MVSQKISLKKTEHEKEDEKKNRVKALLGSVTVYGLLFLLLFFVSLGLTEKPEEKEEPMGADVMLGETTTGMEETFEAETAEPITPQYIAQNFTHPDIPTEESPDAPPVQTSKTPTPPNPIPSEEKPQERQPNPNDLFTKSDQSKKPNKGYENTPGNKGVKKGLPDGKGMKDGVGWSLEGGNLNYIPRPVDESQVFGTITIEITVNKAGKVIGVRGGVSPPGVTPTTVVNDAVIQKYENKAWDAIADPNPDGPERRIGYITYRLSAK